MSGRPILGALISCWDGMETLESKHAHERFAWSQAAGRKRVFPFHWLHDYIRGRATTRPVLVGVPVVSTCSTAIGEKRSISRGILMHRLVPVRLVSAVALVVAGSVAIGAFASPASATATAPTTCSSFVVSIKGTGTLTKCNDPKNTGASGKFVANTKKSPYSAVITWNKTGTTTASLKYAGLAKGAKNLCPKGSTEIVVTGSVTGGTGAAIKSIPKGAKVSADLCYKTSLTLAPKTVFSI